MKIERLNQRQAATTFGKMENGKTFVLCTDGNVYMKSDAHDVLMQTNSDCPHLVGWALAINIDDGSALLMAPQVNVYPRDYRAVEYI